MEKLKGENRKSKLGCSWNSWKTAPHRWVYLSVLLLACAALYCGVLHLHHRSHGYVKQSTDCSDRQLRDQEAYATYKQRHAYLKITSLSERDGAPFLQSQQPPRPREITIVTQISVNRWPHLEKMASAWGGALCVAVYVKTRSEIAAARKKMLWLYEHIEAQRRCRLHLQMVLEEGFHSEADAQAASYPVNALRNVALNMAQTELVFLLDADFVPSPGLHEKLTGNETVYADLLNRTRSKGQLLVVPAFQEVVPRSVLPGTVDVVQMPIPQSMRELRVKWLNGSANSFRWYHPISHDSTSYSHFLHPLTTDPYLVQFREHYEPYFIASRALVPKYDSRFRGYGKNKISHAYSCAVHGFSFVVLPQVYVWEIPHPRSEYFHQFIRERDDPCQTTITDMVYKEFKEELLRYSTHATSNLILGWQHM